MGHLTESTTYYHKLPLDTTPHTPILRAHSTTKEHTLSHLTQTINNTQ